VFNSGDHSGVACIDNADVCDSTSSGGGVSGDRDFNLTAPAGMKRIRVIVLPFGSCSSGGVFYTRPAATFSTDAGEDKTTCVGTPVQFDAVQTAGGTGNFTYSWSPSTYLNSDTSPQPIASPSGTCTPSSSITYTVVVTDTGATSCTVVSDEVKLNICCKPEAEAGPDQAVCAGDSATLGPVNGLNGNYSYRWSPPDGLDDRYLMKPTVSTSADSPSMTVTYTVVWTELDCNSCTDSDEMVLTIHELPDCAIMVDAGASDGIVEPGSTHTAWIATPSGGVGDITWTIQDSEGTDLIIGSYKELTATFKAPLEPTTIKIAVALVDGNGCKCEFAADCGRPGRGKRDPEGLAVYSHPGGLGPDRPGRAHGGRGRMDGEEKEETIAVNP